MLFLRVLEMKSYRPLSTKMSAITIARAVQGELVRQREAGESPYFFTEYILTPKGRRTLSTIERMYRDRPHYDFQIVKRILAGEEYPEWLIPPG